MKTWPFYSHKETAIFTANGSVFRVVLYYRITFLGKFVLGRRVATQFEKHYLGRKGVWRRVGQDNEVGLLTQLKLDREVSLFKDREATRYRKTLLKFHRKVD